MGFLAGGYRAVAQWKGLTLPEQWSSPSVPLHSLLVGWDAADWRYLYPLLEQGKMPALAALMEWGVHSKLATMDPPISPMLWASVATSRWPQDHGIHGFTELHGRTIRAVRGSSIRVPTYWELLERSEIPAGAVAWWPSHPSPATRGAGGVRVSNLAFGAPEFWEAGNNLGPWSSIAQQLLVSPEELPASAVAAFFPNRDLDGSDDVVRSVHKIVLHALNVHTMATLAQDLQGGGHLSVYFDALDHFKHLAAKYAPPKLARVPQEEFDRYQHIVEGAYRLHDLFLGALIDRCDDRTHLFLMSDHGFVHGEERVAQLPKHAGAPALEHRHFGVFVSRSSLWSKDLRVSGLGLLDIAPLVLSAHGLPIPSDMAGRKPLAWQGPFERIDTAALTWSHSTSQPQETASPAPVYEQTMLNDLVELGYLSPDHLTVDSADEPSDSGAPFKTASLRIAENDYYLARSLRAQGNSAQAWVHLQQLLSRFPSPAERYGLLGAGLLHDTQQWEELGRWLERSWERTDSQAWTFYRAVHTLSQGGALTVPDLAIHSVPAAVLWGRLLLRANRFQELSRVIDAVKQHTSVGLDQPDFINLELRLALHREQWEVAAQCALESLEHAYHQSSIHRALAYALSKLGRTEEAALALQTAQLLAPPRPAGRPLFIVTGAPRSGTSLAMQLLKSVGVEPVTDGVRSADRFNSQGFYEHEQVRNWTLDAKWLESQRGKAVKIVLPLLKNAPLPNIPVVVLHMNRSWSAVSQSQRHLMNRPEAALQWDEPARWSQAWDETKVLLDMLPQSVNITFEFEELWALGADPNAKASQGLEAGMRQLNEWLPKPLTLDGIRAVVRPSMRRF